SRRQKGVAEMPAKQRGEVKKLARGWGVRFRDENQERRSASGFATKTAAREWLDAKVAEVEALRRGDTIHRLDKPATVNELLDLFVERHGRTIESNSLATLTHHLSHARRAF